jgi:hypothetical protein
VTLDPEIRLPEDPDPEGPDAVHDEPHRRPGPDEPDRPPDQGPEDGIDEPAMRFPGEEDEDPDPARTIGKP